LFVDQRHHHFGFDTAYFTIERSSETVISTAVLSDIISASVENR